MKTFNDGPMENHGGSLVSLRYTPTPMNQNNSMPHDTREWERRLDDLLASLDPTDSVPNTEPLRNFIHHQLQKARHDWLREEIVRLAEMVEPTQALYTTADLIQTSSTGLQMERNKGNNKALQTIIDRYHSELDQDKK